MIESHMKVKDADGTTRHVKTIAGDDDHVGHMIATGQLQEADRLPTRVALARAAARRAQARYIEARGRAERAEAELARLFNEKG